MGSRSPRIRGLSHLLFARTSTMPEPMSCCPAFGGYCQRCDLLVGLDGLHVTGVERDDGGGLTVSVESAPAPMGCPSCGVVAHGHGRAEVVVVDAPSFGRPVRVRWRKRRWVCPEPACSRRSFVEQDEGVARPRSLLTVRACRWAIAQLRREYASVSGLARQLGTTWNTVWTSIAPLLEKAADDPSRFEGCAFSGSMNTCGITSRPSRSRRAGVARRS